MTAEESLSVAVRGHLSGVGAMSEVKMFGGTGFMLNGNAGCSFVSVRTTSPRPYSAVQIETQNERVPRSQA